MSFSQLANLDQILVRVPQVDGANLGRSPGPHYWPLNYFGPQLFDVHNHFIQRPVGNKAQVQTAGCRKMGLGLKLLAFFVEIDLLIAKLESDAALPESLEVHSQYFHVEFNAGLFVRRGQYQVIQMVDHFFLP